MTKVIRSFPTFRLIAAPIRWLLGTWRRAIGLAALLLATAAAPVVWWEVQLWGLPDIGDPFDVAAFEAETIPAERNAFILYNQALHAFKPVRVTGPAGRTQVDAQLRWDSSPQLPPWLEANRPALDLLRQGADRPDALDPAGRGAVGVLPQTTLMTFLQRLVLLEASRHEAAGRMGEAWDWYRVHLRTSHHVARRAQAVRRREAQAWQADLRSRLADWVANPQTTPDQIRRAIADVTEAGALVPSDLYTLKAQYVALEAGRDGWGSLPRFSPPGWLQLIIRYQLPITPEQFRSIDHAAQTWRREPERSRRLGRLLTANRLAYLDLPPERRPPADPAIATLDLYPFGPEAPESARQLTTDQLDRWLGSSAIAGELTALFNWKVLQVQERASERDLLILLGSELFRRDRGALPITPEELVGPYLAKLPAELPD